MRPVDVVAADDNHGKLETLLVRLDQHLGGRLAGSVGICRREYTRLEQLILALLDLAIDLIGGDVDEAAYTDLLGTLEEDVCTIDVCVREAVGVAEAQVDVRLGGKVQDGVDGVPLHAVDHLGRVGDVALVEGEVAPTVEHAGVVERGAVV